MQEIQEQQIYGIRAVIEAVNAGKTIDRVFLQKGLQGTLYKELLATLQGAQIATQYVPIEKLNRMSKKNHQGVIATLSPVDYQDFEELVIGVSESGKVPLFLVLDHLQDVRNFGAIVRTAECTGVSGIIIPKRGSVSVTADAVKTNNLLYSEDFTTPLAIVMGAEDVGISGGVLKVVDSRVKLPMAGEIGSLNVSVACAVFLYEAVRQRE